MKNVNFYKSKSGNDIMDPKNFTKEIVQYLNSESVYIFKIISNYKYSVLLELGCDEARLHNICMIRGD